MVVREEATLAETCRTQTELARYLGLTPQTLSRLKRQGGGPEWFRLGRCVLYPKDKTEEWLRANRAQ